MLLESLLAYLHISALLAVVVFLSSQAALCRPEWINAAAVKRLQRLDLIYLIAAMALLATGLARAWWGIKGNGWYWSQPLLHIKLTAYLVIGGLSLIPTLAFRRWARALPTLPEPAEVRRVRRWIMIEAHLLMLVPLAAVLLARGVGTR